MDSDGTADLLKKFDELFIATHPGLKITALAMGLPSVALYGIITGSAAFALVERQIWRLETRPFHQLQVMNQPPSESLAPAMRLLAARTRRASM